MSDVLEGGLALKMVRHHGMLWRGMGVSRRGSAHHLDVFILLLVQVFLAHEVFRAFVLVRSAILRVPVSALSPGGHGGAYILIPADGLIDIAGRELVQLLVVSKYDHSNVDGAEDGELVGLLEETAFALEEGAGRTSVGIRDYD